MFYCALLACELIVSTSSFRGFHILNKKKIITVSVTLFIVESDSGSVRYVTLTDRGDDILTVYLT